jgi:serine/threonine protein kinase
MPCTPLEIATRAERARADGKRLLKPPRRLVGNARTEVVPAVEQDERVPAARQTFINTLAEPNTISVDASEHRVSIATRAGVLSSAIDVAVSARAKNSIEKMLCHQMAAVHIAGMEVLTRLQEEVCIPDVREGDTARGAVLGTPAYMPPEQAAGHPVDERADVYALGALLFHVLAGKPPYDGPDAKRPVDEASATVPSLRNSATVLSQPNACSICLRFR